MAAYLLANLDVQNQDAHAEFAKQVQGTLDPFQGRFLARGGATETVEGEWNPGRVVLIEFPSMEQARAWYNSPAYQAILPTRHRNARAQFLALIEGVPS